MNLKKRLIFDGAMGTELQKMGLAAGELPERWNLLHPERIASVHRAYFAAGADVVCTNTFGANCLKFSDSELFEIISSAVKIAKEPLWSARQQRLTRASLRDAAKSE